MRNTVLSFLFLLSLVFCFSCRRDPTPIAPASVLRLSMEGDPQTLDPRKTRDLGTTTIIHMLYEGLMRLTKEGVPALAMAEDVNVSDDHRVYTFKIRKATWSNGKAVTAMDFEQTWKSVLDPNFPSPNAYQLFVIKGAKDAKEGKIPVDQVKVKATNDSTLVVELENPTPYFLNLTSAYFYYPVSPEMRQDKSGSEVITNGPFKMQEWVKQDKFVAVKNPNYWNNVDVEIDKIVLYTLDNTTALALFEKGQLDWAGSPMGTIPVDALATLKKEKRLQITPAAGVYLFRYNTEKPPFNHAKLRQAFCYALNRQDLVEHTLQGNQIPAMGLIPPSFINHTPIFRDYNLTKAQHLFKEALTENHIEKSDLAPITICYASGERAHKIAQVVQQQWKQAFGIDVNLQVCESKLFYDQLKNKNYQLAIGAWFADFRDPISFLDVFKFKDNGTNNTQWENPRYVQLLNFSCQTSNYSEREKLLREAELVLMEDMPIIPLFYSSYNYVKQPHVKDIYFSELGYLDFKYAYFE